MRKIAILLFVLAGFLQASAQLKFPEHEDPDESIRNKGNGFLLHLSFGGQLPAGDMAKRFGQDGFAGVGWEFITKTNYFAGVNFHYMFGTNVKEDPLDILRTPEGEIIGNDRSYASVVLRERGWYAGGQVGKMFTFGEKRSGLRVCIGGGWLQHKIRVQDDLKTVTQLTGDYKKGYDRLTGGPSLTQFVGWQHLAANRRANFIAGFDFTQSFSNTRRDWDFSAMRKLDEKRLDVLVGLRLAWIVPLYIGRNETIYY